MRFAGGETFIIFVLAVFAFHVWAILDVVRRPASEWQSAGQNQVLWAIVVLLLSIVGPIIYLAIARPQLVAAESSSNQ